jgi:ammonium transporter, Amt family
LNALVPQELPPLSQAICIFCILLVPLTLAGISLINTGLGRSRSSAHVMMSSLCVMSIAAVVYCVCGFHWEGFPGQPAHVFTFATNPWDWLGAGRFFLGGIAWNGSAASLAVCLQLFSVGLVAVIPLGAGADRWKLGASCASTALLAGWIYPLFAHWVWGGGWLAQLGTNFGLGRGFLDAAGSSTIQIVGGLSGLSAAWLLGPRRGKYSSNGMPAAIPGHNAIYVLFGCLLAFAGWLGLNSAGAMLFAGILPEKIVLIAANTLLSAASAALVTELITQMRFGKPDASLTANGWVGGLVASSAAGAFIHPAEAIIIGIIAGALVTMSVQWLEFNLKVDDPTGSISVHGLAGIWGILAAGLFARFQTPVKGQFIAQLVGLATLLGFIFPLTYGLNALVSRFYPYRVSMDGERQGMDLHELGADAYPEFVTHSDEYSQR